MPAIIDCQSVRFRAAWNIVVALCFLVNLLPNQAISAELISGFCVSSQRKPAEREAVLDQLEAAGVRVIRTSFPGRNPGDFNIDFAKKAFDKRIKIVLIFTPQSTDDSKRGLSEADPATSKAYFQALIDRLEKKGVVLEAMELGNEINWFDFNDDFPRAGQGRGKLYNYKELSEDPAAARIARGFRQYVKLLACLKEVRDRSSLNQKTPIISAGLTDFNSEYPKPSMKLDAVNLVATVHYLRDNGMDKYVDGYGLHRYPKDKTPQARRERLSKAVEAFNLPNDQPTKPIWITEWGVDNNDENCPCNDDKRVPLVNETVGNIHHLAKEGRVVASIYYHWDSQVKKGGNSTVYRCGELLESGKLVIKPFSY